MTGRNFGTWGYAPTEVRLQSSHRVWEKGVLSLLMNIFQNGDSQVFEKDILWIVKLAKGF